MFRILFLLFLTVPLIEIYFLIQVGREIGAFSTVLLCILTAALGAILLRIQGILTLMNAREKLRQGEIPADNLLEGLILLIAAVLLLTPGFVTDVIGFLCLVPSLRSMLALRMLHQAFRDDLRRRNIIVEGEFWEEDNQLRIRQSADDADERR
ncbi:MAG: FxsA family protein [Gammaproteobacteria bacterium]|nr:FxsA family protein [Gammaproteobacteria bacterium]